MAHMAPKYIILTIMLLFTTNISAFNITRLLNNHPQFSTFNDLLTQTGVAAEINKRQTITILVIENSGMGPITSKPQSTIKKILQTHALLDYYDTNKISDLSKSGSTAINFYQNTGVAYREQGQTRVINSGGDIIFASAMKGGPHDSKMVKSIAAQPYNISVIQISQPIVTPGLDQNAPSGPVASPVATPPAAAQPPKKAEVPAPQAESPTEDLSPAADGPASEGPSVGDGPSLAPGPAQDGDVADKEAPAKLAPPPKSGGSQLIVGGGYVIVLGILSLFELM
ncbi:hypothetical protein vseg_002678 [Gypsophila vaccaria]